MALKRFTRWSHRIERNILAVYARANESDRSEGMYWYAQAHNTAKGIAERHGVTLEQATGVIAALSPGRQWGLNVMESEEFIRAWQAGERGRRLPIVGTYGKRNINKAVKILEGLPASEVLHTKRGPKVWAFYNNILNPHTSKELTVDQHAKCLAYNLPSTRSTGASSYTTKTMGMKEYQYIAWHYRTLAERLGLVPHQLQAITWVTWKRIQGRLEQAEIPF